MADPYTNTATPWRDQGELKRLFVDEEMNTYEIADELNTTHVTVSKWLDEFGIREKKQINKEKPWRDEGRVRELYVEKKLTIPQLADELDCAYRTAYLWLKRHGIERRGRLDEAIRIKKTKPASHRITKDGYEVAGSNVDGSTKSARIHRLVMVAENGFDAVIGNIVHHKNGIPWDNRPSNLEIMTPEEHGKLHRPVEVRWGHTTPVDALQGAMDDE